MRLHLCLVDRECWRHYFQYGMPMRLHIGNRFITILPNKRRSKRIWDESEER